MSGSAFLAATAFPSDPLFILPRTLPFPFPHSTGTHKTSFPTPPPGLSTSSNRTLLSLPLSQTSFPNALPLHAPSNPSQPLLPGQNRSPEVFRAQHPYTLILVGSQPFMNPFHAATHPDRTALHADPIDPSFDRYSSLGTPSLGLLRKPPVGTETALLNGSLHQVSC